MMRYLPALALACAIPLAACQTVPPLPVPSEAADRTVIDEKAAILAETAYSGASRLGLVAARAGLIDAARFKALDARAYRALGLVRAAYRAGNAPGFDAAVRELDGILAGITALVQEG